MDVSPKAKLRVAVKSRSKLVLSALIVVAGFIAMPSWAAFITTNEVGMDSIFADPDFGTDTIDIRFNPSVTHYDSTGTLLNIDSSSKFSSLSTFYQGLFPANIVRMFFVDTITFCGGKGGFAGCADNPGNNIFVNSVRAANTGYGKVINSHELAHNLGVTAHDNTSVDEMGNPNNLMHSTVTNSNHTDLLPAQVDAILMSPLIQFDGSQRFVSITPILITDIPVVVPIPSALILCFTAIGSLGLFGRGRRRQTARSS